MKIYILNVEGSNLYKIGITKNSIKSRILNLQVGNPHLIKEVWNFESESATKVERAIHRHYKYCKSIGEWFLFNDISIEEVKEKIIKIESIIKELNGKEESPY